MKVTYLTPNLVYLKETHLFLTLRYTKITPQKDKIYNM